MGSVLVWGDRGCSSSDFAGESDSSIVTRLLFSPKVVLDTFDTERDIPMSISRTTSSDFWMGDRELGTEGIGAGGTCVRIGGASGSSVSCGNEIVNGVIKENTSEILFESLHSSGDFMAIMLVGETGVLSKEIGDEDAEDTRLITLFSGKTAIPHLLTGRAGAGVSSGVTGDFRSDGEGGGGAWIVASACSR